MNSIATYRILKATRKSQLPTILSAAINRISNYSIMASNSGNGNGNYKDDIQNDDNKAKRQKHSQDQSVSSKQNDDNDNIYLPTSTDFQPRYAGPPLTEMTPAQKSLRESILRSRPNTGLSGPFGPWLAVPSIAMPSQELGRVCRYETSLSKRESELVILLTGARFKSEGEFDIHVGEARRAGIGMEVVKSIPRGRLLSQMEGMVGNGGGKEAVEFSLENVERFVIPALEKDHDEGIESVSGESDKSKEREVAIVLFTAELLETFTVSDDTYKRTKEALDGKDSVLVEINAIVGYYAYVAFTLNVFNIPSGVQPTD
ncbi:hypothetical protein ACHAXS_010560 [Conticribra weissflogii]